MEGESGEQVEDGLESVTSSATSGELSGLGYVCGPRGDKTLTVVMDARSAMRPCYILPFFNIFFYGRLSWPNG